MKHFIFLLSLLLFTATISSCSDEDSEILTGEDSLEDLSGTITKKYTLTATGQTILYDKDGNKVTELKEGASCYGQDASYLSGEEMSYNDNGDKTVTDNNTGLMWQQIPSTKDMTWAEAKEFCENLELGGYDDWRMPSAKELYSISNFQEGWPYINTDIFSLVQEELTKDEQYWSSNLYVGVAGEQGSGLSGDGTPPPPNDQTNGMLPPPLDNDTETNDGETEAYAQKAFGVNYATGHIKAYIANASGPIGGKYIRAVRGAQYGINSYTDNGDKTITDSNNGLMWSKNDAGPMDWETALKYAEDSKLAGYDDWRLPNVKELQNIVDYNYSPSAIETENQGAAIHKIFNCTPIKNEAGTDDYGYYWTSTSARFQKGGNMYYAWYVAFGRAVDGDGEDVHGAGAVRFDTKYESGNLGEGGERFLNYIRLVRNLN